ncbi:CRAL/TRIO domain-containing protein [Marasmius fiardii PR-910]|nr:CRAL/TRIO domain-containing protein [Marasmius fiardii PR-910]
MDTSSLLQANCDRLLGEYQANLNATLELQAILIEEILPSVATELELDEAQLEWIKEWLEDTPMVFYVMRKQQFTRSFALDTIRKNIEWRVNNLWPPKSDLYLQNVHCLPVDVRDPLGRPILVVRAVDWKESSDQRLTLLFHVVERLRVCLKALNDAFDEGLMPFLQYVVILDVKEFSMRHMSIEFCARLINELTPRFPGMLAAVFILNSSWTQAGLWNIAKRLLPATAISRVFFPSSQELINYFTPSSIPKG